MKHAAVPLLLFTVAACGGSRPHPQPAPTPAPDTAPAPEAAPALPRAEPLLPPQIAMLAGLMPLRSIGVDQLRADNPAWDGRGVLIGILDSGVDAGVPGLRQTSTGTVKLLDVRDFSGEGRISLARIIPDGDLLAVDNIVLRGAARLAGLAKPPYYGGALRERPLGAVPGSDVNGDGDNADRFPVVVARASDGWFVLADTNGDGSLADEKPVRDYALHHETFAWGPLTMAANLGERDGAPVLNLFFDNSGHGTHVAGIAAGYRLFGMAGFHGVAPGAQVLALKISNNARGGISTTASMIEAMEYAADFAGRRNLPLVLNLSFGVGNEGSFEGTAIIDSLVDAFAVEHPDVLFVISAGNDGPGISTVGFPGSAEFALTACALFPGAFAQPPQPGVRPAEDVLGWWSSRGGETAKPDLCAPGVAFSNVPPWQTGQEVSGGTSMAAPQLAGAAALLHSALAAQGRTARAVDLKRALIATARPVPGASVIDVGTGVPSVPAALRWLRAAHQAGRYRIRALDDGGNSSRATAAYRRGGLAPGDTLQRFLVAPVTGQPHTRLLLRSDAPWLTTPAAVEFRGGPETVAVTYDRRKLVEPGLYVGTVWARPASDTLGGAAFGLTSTIIVPHTLDTPLHDRRQLHAGGTRRYFVEVPEHAGGLEVDLRLSDPGSQATLYLFEPTGQPQREESTVEVGGGTFAGHLEVRADDLVPGVYEAVVVAPPLSPVTYTLRASLPAVRVAELAAGEVRLAGQAKEVAVSADAIGVQRAWDVEGAGDAVRHLDVAAPDWADLMVVDVQLPPELWSRFTDFGVTVFDSTGQLLSDGPLNYAFGRQKVKLAGLEHRALTVELMPAWARALPDAPWRATVRVAFVSEQTRTLLDRAVRVDGDLVLPLGALPHDAPETPEPFTPLIRAVATDSAGVSSVLVRPVPLKRATLEAGL